jgi:hypothetical protein
VWRNVGSVGNKLDCCCFGQLLCMFLACTTGVLFSGNTTIGTNILASSRNPLIQPLNPFRSGTVKLINRYDSMPCLHMCCRSARSFCLSNILLGLVGHRTFVSQGV